MRNFLKPVLAVVLAGSIGAAIPTAAFGFTALESTRATGNQSWVGSLGMDFDVLSPINVEQLGAYDSDQDGLAGIISVGIFDRTTGLLAAGSSSVTIDFSNPLIGFSRYEDMTDFVLGVGQYSIVAKYFTTADPNGNTGGGAGGPTIDTGGGLISFVGTSRYEDNPIVAPFIYPTTVDTGPSNRYDAGTFIYTAAIPEPETYAMLLAGLGLMGFVARRRRQRTA